ncbi:endolytic transglycosylase MltG [Acidithrix sp. C25]|uniref:endolytic transglycosylase MltG n=1 Tax=Acidithrix sp. C25 TaxID=1671482 RepID=UPI00191BB9FD|nr:endolytic transglycosylase MltG [Acidithrix sp. C25]
MVVEDHDLTKRRRVTLRGKVIIGILSIVFIVIISAFLAWSSYQRGISGAIKGSVVNLLIKSGDNYSIVGRELAGLGVIRSSFYFDIYLKLNAPPSLLPGEYTFHKNESAKAVISVFRGGANEYRLTIIPGMTVAQIAHQVAKIPGHSLKSFDKALSKGNFKSPFLPPGSTNLEGLLSPNTYFVLPNEPDSQLIQEMLDETTKVASQAGLSPSTRFDSISAYQVLIVASLIQREALLSGDYAKVARVIYNRLAIPMNLQFDSTVLYGLGLTGGSPTYQQLKVATRYNTYLNPGLPPTPISAPGESAIHAALNPASGPWIYFVTVSSNGAEAFSTTYSQQLANEALAGQRGLG